MLVSLAECLYGMDLYKERFLSEEAEKKCLCNIVQYFAETHSKGEMVGPIDIRKLQIDLVNGNITIPQSEPINELFNSVDTLKFLSPEILKEKSSWTIHADNFFLATVLFSVEFFIHPFDGMLVYEKPVTNTKQAVDFYSNPIFVFDTVDTRNQALGYNDGKAISKWEKCNACVKDYYIRNFTTGIHQVDMRVDAKDALNVFPAPQNSNEVRILEINDKRFNLYEGLELYESDVEPNSSGNQKLLVVIKSTKNENILALGNTSNDTWSVYLPDSKEVMVSPKSVAPIVQGATISIGEYLANII